MAMEQSIFALEFASDALLGDRRVIMLAVIKDGVALGFASDELRGDREVVMAAVQRTGGALEYAPTDLRGEREVVMAAVTALQVDGDYALCYASVELCGDREVVMAAVQRDGGALKCASDDLRGDREVVTVAVKHGGDHLEFAHAELRADPYLQSWQYLSSSQAAWRRLRDHFRVVRPLAMWWSDLTMKATLDENGQAKMVGCGAKRLRDEYEGM